MERNGIVHVRLKARSEPFVRIFDRTPASDWWVFHLGALMDHWRLRRLPPHVTVIDIYQRLYRHGRWLGIDPRPGATQREFASVLGQRVSELADDRRWSPQLRPALGEIRRLTEVCNRTLYSVRRTRRKDQQRALRIWVQLRRRLWLARILAWAPW